MSTNKAQVLIVGAGPVGLMVANELVRKNVSVRIIDQSATPSPVTISKALAIHARTLEILDEIGIIQEFLDRSIKVNGLKTYNEQNEVVMNVSFDVIKDSKYPFIISLPQGVTEEILRKKLESSGVMVDRNLAVKGLVQDEDGVTVTIDNLVDKTTETSRYEYVVGADGAHSAIRKLLGLSFQGEKYDANMSLCDVTIDWDLDPNYLYTWGASTFMLGAIPIPGGNRYRIILDEFSNHVQNTSGVEHGLISGSPVDISHFEKFFSQVYPKAKLIDMTWSTKFNISHRLVNKWHIGRTFVAGDAAHIHSPVGGQGMNTGLCDAYNLAWKLSSVIHRTSPSSILDSYDSERSHAASVVVSTTDKSTKMMTLENPLAQQVRNKVLGFLTSFEYVQSSFAHTTAQLVQNYATCNSPIIASEKGWFRGSTTTVAAGWRALDVELADGSSLLNHVWNGRENKHTAFFVLNVADLHSAKFDEIERIALQVSHRYSEGTQVVVCLPEQAKENHNLVKNPLKAIYDSSNSHNVFSVYGVNADEAAIYVVRPDGYVGFASKPVAADKLLSYLQTILIRK